MARSWWAFLLGVGLGGCSESTDEPAATLTTATSSSGTRASSAGGSVGSSGGTPATAGNATSNGVGGAGGDGNVGGAGADGGLAGAGADAGLAGAGGSMGAAVWTPESQSIEVHWFSYWTGGYWLRRARHELSAEQQQRLEALRIVDPINACTTDAPVALVKISGAQGAEQAYSAHFDDHGCDQPEEFVAYASLESFLEMFECLPAGASSGRSLQSAPSIAVGDGCHHGLYNSLPADEWWFLVNFEAAGSYVIATDGCFDRELELVLFEDNAIDSVQATETLVAECAALQVDIAQAGSYPLQVTMADGQARGDFYLSVEPVP